VSSVSTNNIFSIHIESLKKTLDSDLVILTTVTNRFLKSILKRAVKHRWTLQNKGMQFKYRFIQRIGEYLRDQQDRPTVAELLTIKKLAQGDKFYECDPFTTDFQQILEKLRSHPNDIVFLEKWGLITEIKDNEQLSQIQSESPNFYVDSVKQHPAVVSLSASITEMAEEYIKHTESRTLMNMVILFTKTNTLSHTHYHTITLSHYHTHNLNLFHSHTDYLIHCQIDVNVFLFDMMCSDPTPSQNERVWILSWVDKRVGTSTFFLGTTLWDHFWSSHPHLFYSVVFLCECSQNFDN
jgi:hypothetical protein